jgi:hypothetical protein
MLLGRFACSSAPPQCIFNVRVLVALAVGDVRSPGDDEPAHRADGRCVRSSMPPQLYFECVSAMAVGSYERIEQNTKNAMRRQRAELLVSLEVLMTDEERANPDYFPRWIHWYRPKEREEEEDGAENGVINGVGRQLESAKKELEARITTLQESADSAKKEMQEHNDEIKKELEDRIASLQETVKAQQLAMEAQHARTEAQHARTETQLEQQSAQLQAILAAVSAGRSGPEPEPEP